MNQRFAKWPKLQDLLKQQYYSFSTQNQQKKIFQKQLQSQIKSYHHNFIHLHPTISIKSVTRSTNFQEIGEKQIIQDQGFKDCYVFIKQIILALSKNPYLMNRVIKKHMCWKNISGFKSIAKLIVNSMYENVVDDRIYNKDILKIYDGIAKLLVQSNSKYYQKGYHQQNICTIIMKQLFDKPQINGYRKQVVRLTLLQIVKLDKLLDFKKISETQVKEKQLKSKADTRSKISNNQNLSQKHIPTNHQQEKAHFTDTKMKEYLKALHFKDQKYKTAYVKTKYRNCVTAELMHELKIQQGIQTPNFVNTEIPHQKEQQQLNQQMSAIIAAQNQKAKNNIPDIKTLKKIILIFYSDIFRMLYSMPEIIRIFAKLFFLHASKKYSNNHQIPLIVVGNFIINYWITSAIAFDQQLMQAGKLGDYTKQNTKIIVTTINGILQNDFSNINDHFQNQISSMIKYLRMNIFNYLKEVVNINFGHNVATHEHQIIYVHDQNVDLTSQLRDVSTQIISYSVCLSVSDVRKIIDMIKNYGSGLKNQKQDVLGSKLYKRAKAIDQMAKDLGDIFGQKTNSNNGKVYEPYNAYVIFTQFSMPNQLSLDYLKYYQNTFKNQRIKNLIKLILLNQDDLQTLVQFCPGSLQENFTFSKMLVDLMALDKSVHHAIDTIPNRIKIKYLLSITNQEQLQVIGEQMIQEAQQRLQYLRKVWSRSKQCYLKAIANITTQNERIKIFEVVYQKQQKKKKLDYFIKKTSIDLCLTSPKTRQKDKILKAHQVQFTENEDKIWMSHQDKCIHTAVNLQFIKNLTGVSEKKSQQFQFESHCNSIMQFPDIFCSMPQVKQKAMSGEQHFGIRQIFRQFINYCIKFVEKKSEDYEILLQNRDWLQDSIEMKISKRIYERLYPSRPTYEDLALYLRLKTLSFVTCENLKIASELHLQNIWQIAGAKLRMMEKAKTAAQKLSCLIQCFKIISDTYILASKSDQPANNEDINPIIIYVLIKSGCSKFLSNIHFIETFGNPSRLVSIEGNFLSQIKSIVHACDLLNHEKLGLQLADFQRLIYEKQVQYGIYFLLSRKTYPRGVVVKSLRYIREVYMKIEEKEHSNILLKSTTGII